MPMPNRNIQDANGYRYAYQGQEKDPETGKEAFELRLWDGRIGRWLTKDPYGQHFSPYLGMGNNPISRIDPNGGSDDWIDNGDGTWTAEPGDGAWTLSQDAGIPLSEAFALMDAQGYGTYIDMNDGILKSAIDPKQIVTVDKFSSIKLDEITINASKSKYNLNVQQYSFSSISFNGRGWSSWFKKGRGIQTSYYSGDAYSKINNVNGNYTLTVSGTISAQRVDKVYATVFINSNGAVTQHMLTLTPITSATIRRTGTNLLGEVHIQLNGSTIDEAILTVNTTYNTGIGIQTNKSTTNLILN